MVRTHFPLADSSSKPAVASSFVPAYEPPVQPVASHSFAVDLNGSVGEEVGEGEYLRTSLQCVTPAGVGDGFLDDSENDNVEPDMIADDSGDDVGANSTIIGFLTCSWWLIEFANVSAMYFEWDFS
ncbi:hypothetical protein Ahy_A01g000090 [Arachis hypogaea]|uniref:Uncharacterized protein n=1 Tax=Arachis hypogaea TaxID=3818 RepID=A0A445EJM9_ARAHY|nr:hypothetical protein Ahy_A01g000090 [Arachis hypogaea]